MCVHILVYICTHTHFSAFHRSGQGVQFTSNIGEALFKVQEGSCPEHILTSEVIASNRCCASKVGFPVLGNLQLESGSN